MPPPSNQRRPRTRRVSSSDPHDEMPDSSPSRPRTKRRKVCQVYIPACVYVCASSPGAVRTDEKRVEENFRVEGVGATMTPAPDYS